MNIKQIFLLILYFIAPIPAIIAFINETFPSYRQFGHIVLSSLGIIAFVWLCFEFVLMARPRWLDQSFGMDKVTQFHLRNSLIMMIASVIHRGLGEFLEEGFEDGLGEGFGEEGFQTALGSFALVLFGILMIIGIIFMVPTILNKIPLYNKAKKFVENLLHIRYNLLKSTHNIMIIATIVLYAHLMLASTTRYSVIMRIVYSCYFGLALLIWIWHKLLRPLWIQRNPYTVEAVIQETRDIWTLRLKPDSGHVLKYRPGQYCYITINAPTFTKEPHPFSLSSNPLIKDMVTVTIKELGDFTRRIREVPVGAKVYLDGPYGILTLNKSHLEDKTHEMIMVAGGVGITPFLSQLDYLRSQDPQQKVTFIYGIRTIQDQIRPHEFEQYQKEMPNLKIYPVVSDDKTWEGERGFIDQPRLERLSEWKTNDHANIQKVFFICGPPLMLEMVLKSLKKMKVNPHSIHTEHF